MCFSEFRVTEAAGTSSFFGPCSYTRDDYSEIPPRPRISTASSLPLSGVCPTAVSPCTCLQTFRSRPAVVPDGADVNVHTRVSVWTRLSCPLSEHRRRVPEVCSPLEGSAKLLPEALAPARWQFPLPHTPAGPAPLEPSRPSARRRRGLPAPSLRIALTNDDSEHLSMCSFALRISSLVKHSNPLSIF